MFRVFINLLLFLLVVSAGYAQSRPDPKHPESENLKLPSDWKVKLDHPDKNISIGHHKSDDIWFVNMTPGWHITTGPAGIFYLPGNTVRGNFRTETKIHLFDPKGRNETFGLFIGGQNLERENQSYTYFLIRNSGEFLIKKRTGSKTEVVKEWTRAPVMNRYTDSAKSSVANILAIETNGGNTHFFLNGEKLFSLPGEEIDTEGIVGLRINHELNVHVEGLAIREASERQ